MKKSKVVKQVIQNRVVSNSPGVSYFDYKEGDILHFATKDGQVLAFHTKSELESFIHLHHDFSRVKDTLVNHAYNTKTSSWDFQLIVEEKVVVKKVKVVKKKKK